MNSIADYKAWVAKMGFDPKAPETVVKLEDETNSFSWAEASVFAVVNDCGPKIVAAFAFQHHAEAFVKATGETMYLCDDEGNPVEEE